MSEWREEDAELVRDFEFKDFGEAMTFVNRVADLAEEANHHPDILVHGWNKVRLTLSTHSEGRITDNDHELAARIDELA
jgi:4a-hydroxytetrahydrobiopterin dehydratase